MTKYNSGVRFERYVRDVYKNLGYVVIRSAGSKGPCDLVCFSDNKIVLVQCKVERKGKNYKKDLEKLRSVPANNSLVFRELWVKRVRGDIVVYNGDGVLMEVLKC